MAEQNLENLEFDGGQLNSLILTENSSSTGNHPDIPDDQPLWLAPTVWITIDAAQNGPQAREQFAGIEWFGQIVVGADLETNDPVDILSSRSQHKDRDARGSPNLPQRFELFQIRKHDIEDDQGESPRQCRLDSFQAVLHRLDCKTSRSQILAQQTTEIGIVINNQNGSYVFVQEYLP